jgi:HK97 family phage major capsid protein
MEDQSMRDYLLKKIKGYVEQAEAIIAKAEAENREMTEDESAEVRSIMGRVEEHKVEVKKMEDREALRSQLEALGSVSTIAAQETVEVKARTPGEAFVTSPEYKAIVAQAASGGFPKFEMAPIELKAPGDAVLESGGTNDDAIAPTWYGLETPGLVQYPLRVQSVMNIVALTTGNTAYWPVVTTRTVESGATTEGAAKAGAEFGFDVDSATVSKWTAFGGASEEMFQDAPTLTNYINTEIGVMALQKEEAAIITALYAAATDNVDGSGIGGSIGYDAVLEAITSIRIAGGTPNVILLHPNDWARLAATRAVAGDGDYFSGGPYATPSETLWGSLRQVQTPNVPEGTGLVGDFGRGARLFRKGGLRVDSSNSHSDYFEKNLIAIRGEIRSVTGVSYPEFFVEVFLGS